jgi:hypothetical protein
MKQTPLARLSFTQGVKSAFDPSSVPPDALYGALNMRSDESGILRIRRGHSPVNITPLGTGSFQGGVSAFGKVLTAWNRNLYLIDNAGASTQIGTGLIGATATDRVSMIRWTRSGLETVYLFPGNGIFQTQGSSTAAVTPYTPAAGESLNLIRKTDGTLEANSGPSRCKLSVLKASLSQRIAAAGDPQSPNTVYFSAPLDATYWPDDQIIQLPDDGSKITRIVNWYNTLIIFRDKDIWAFFGSSATDTSAQLVLQDSSVGCAAGESVAAVPNIGLMFLGPDNIYALQTVTAIENQVKSVPIGDDVRKFVKKALTFDMSGISAVYYNKEYRLSFPKCMAEERVLVLSTVNNTLAWYPDSGPVTNQFIIHNNSCLASSDLEGKWLKYDETRIDDDGAPIPIALEFRRENLQPGPGRIKHLYIYAISKGRSQQTSIFYMGDTFGTPKYNDEIIENAVVNVGTDQHLTVDVTADGTTYTVKEFSVTVDRLAAASLTNIEPVRIFEARFQPSLKGNFAQVRISGTVPDEEIVIMGYAIDYSTRGRIHGQKFKV